jgi:hypothetical protein
MQSSCLNAVIDSENYHIKSCDPLNLTDKNIRVIWLSSLVNLNITCLDISKNPLKWLPDIFTLKYLNCSNCALTELPVYLPVIEEIICSNNLICTIPIYKSLVKLICSGNNINKIDHLPKLKYIDCSSNPITDYPSDIKCIATNCPITVKKFSKKQTRSGFVKHGKFEWIEHNLCELSDKYILIDWCNARTTVEFHGRFAKRLAKFLFYYS